MAQVTIDDIIGNANKELLDIFKRDYREILDQKITLLDLSYEALKVNVYRNTATHIAAYNNAYELLVKVLDKESKRKYKSLAEVPPGYFQKKNFSYVYIDGGNSNRFIVANSFGAADTVLRKLSRDPDLIKTSFGTNSLLKDVLNKKGQPTGDVTKTLRRKSDIGHISTEGAEALTSPLELKIQDVLKFGSATSNRVIESIAKKALDDLYAIQAEAQYSFKNVSPEDISLTKGILGTGYVVVTLHRSKLNNKFSQEEARIFFNLKAAIANIVGSKDFINVHGSNTILQDIRELVLNAFDPKLHKVPKKHIEHKKTSNVGKLKPNSSTKAVITSVKKANITEPAKPTFSLISLQNLLNVHLQDVISANMGTGNSTNILNYRTGRFAANVRVKYLSQSREGMITAFYSYMKNPYATFSTGGAQSSPASRDPKLLISKSIREIAATQVANRMRAVSV